MIGQLRSLGINREGTHTHTFNTYIGVFNISLVEEFSQPQNQEFVYLNPPPDFSVIEGDIM